MQRHYCSAASSRSASDGRGIAELHGDLIIGNSPNKSTERTILSDPKVSFIEFTTGARSSCLCMER